MANENEYSERSFSLGKPLDKTEKERMLHRIKESIAHVFSIVGMCNEVHQGESEEDRIKRVYLFSAKVSEFMADRLEKSGAAVILDKEHTQALLLDMITPIPALVEGFGTDVLDNKK